MELCLAPFCSSPKYVNNNKSYGYCKTHICERTKYKIKAFKELLPLWCPLRCKTHGLLKSYQIYFSKVNGKQTTKCRICTKTYVNSLYNPAREKKLRELRREQKKERAIKCKYGLSKKDIESILFKQDYKCAICLIDFKEYLLTKAGKKRRSFDIDHCHKTGKIRGLLCHKCNISLGYFNDDSLRITQALSYLNCT